jgi:HK97 gp10 family phage protein
MGYTESGIYVTGLNEMVAGLKAMGAEKELLALNLKVGNIVADEARRLVPTRTTQLQGSIKSTKTLKGVVVVAGKDPYIPYANAINWGWFYDRKNFVYKNIKPVQFMNKAARRKREQIVQFYIEDLLAIYNKYSKTASNMSTRDYLPSSSDYTTRKS